MPSPKVLIIGQPFNNNGGGGITQANLFGGWDKNKIAVVCTVHMFDNLNTEICDTYYLLGNNEYKWAFPFNFLQRKVESGIRIVKATENKSSVPQTPAKVKFRTKIIDNYFYPFCNMLVYFTDYQKLNYQQHCVNG
ncbi:MAG: hypothetical protein WDM90_18645 [Ferruginibacter sp.]